MNIAITTQIAQDTIQVKTFAETSEEEERGNGKKILERGQTIDTANKKSNREGATKHDKNNQKAQRRTVKEK